ncbi:MAG: phage tail sheath C-terminal domain-containing protein [Desulfobacterales bacterium]|jgi:phage tail sheath protein FI
MPITTTYPGVYIEEVPSGVRTIVGVATSVAAFVDFFERGPINQAVQVFSKGDFNREFGGLHSQSEASYAIHQFFNNGGTDAWVVRTAEDTTFATATVVFQGNDPATSTLTDVLRATAGRQLKGTLVEDPGSWANNLRIDVDYDTSGTSTLPSFNLTVSEVAHQDGRQVIIQTETYRNLNMGENDANYAVDVVNDGSKLIQLTRLSAAGVTNIVPAQTGTIGTDASATGSDAVGNLTASDTFDIAFLSSADNSATTVTATVQFTGTLTTLQQVRRILQATIRLAGATLTPAEPLLTGATVQLINNQFRVLAGRTGNNFDAHKTLTFSDNSGTPASDMGLTTGALNNVQQYSMGSTTSTGAQVGGTAGANGNPPGATELIGIRDPDKSGMYALEDVDLFNILCIPRAAELTDVNHMQAVYSDALIYCVERRAFLIIDIPEATNNLEDARDWLEDNSQLRHRNAAAYFPRPKIPDPLNDYRLRSVGASGTIAGLYARTDATRGVWKAPAGIEAALRNVPDLDYRLTDPENGQLNPLGFNCLRTFDVIGNVCWGARTLVGADQLASEWKYVPVRRIALFIEESLFRGTQWVVFEPNDEPLWAQIRLNVGAFMQNLFRQGAFQGTTPRQAYLVKCDAETTTQNDINLGVVNILVGFAPLKPAEFVIIRIQQLAGQVEA